MSPTPSTKPVSAPAAASSPARPPRPVRRRRFQAVALAVVLGSGLATVWLALRFDPFGRAQADFDRRRYVDALGAAETYLKRWPGEPRASLMAARCAARIGQPARAEAHFAHAGTLEVEDLHDRAYGMIRMQRPGEALELYDDLLARKPNDALALKRCAAVLMGLKRYSRLDEIVERLSAVPGEEVAGRTLSGIQRHVDRSYPEAADEFLKVLELDPELKSMPLPKSLFWNHLAVDLLAQGRFAEARTHLERAIADAPDAGLIELLGTTYQQEGRPDEAERYWRQAIERDPSLPDPWLDLGNLAIARRQPADAVPLFKRAVELAPDSAEAHQNLSAAYQMLDQLTEAERFRKIAADLRARRAQSQSAGASRDPDSAIAASAAGRQR